jgi:hypothetical protein
VWRSRRRSRGPQRGGARRHPPPPVLPLPPPLPCAGGAARARAPGRRRRSSCARRRPAGGSSSPAPCPPAVNQARPLLRRWICPLLRRARSAPTHRRSRGGRPPGQRRNHAELIPFLPIVGGESSFVGGSSLPAAPPQWLMSADRAPWRPPSGLPLRGLPCPTAARCKGARPSSVAGLLCFASTAPRGH